MPIHSTGYREWDGRRAAPSSRWTVISTSGIKRTWPSKWLRRMIFVSFMATLVFVVPLYLFEQAVREHDQRGTWIGMITSLPQTASIADSLRLDFSSPEKIGDTRHTVWSFLLLTLFRYPQAFILVLVVGIAAPPLISNDVRTRAFLIYFSRPITRSEYILGKMGTLVFYIGAITTAPALLFYLVGVMISPNLGVILSTWDIPLRILAASVVLILPTASLALMFSSVTSESRYAGFAWFAVWIIGYVMYLTVVNVTAVSRGELHTDGWRLLLSPYHTLGVVQSWIFGLTTDDSVIAPAILVLSCTTAFSLWLLYRKVSSPMQA